jgi:hypothetical protein
MERFCYVEIGKDRFKKTKHNHNTFYQICVVANL